MSDIKLLPCPFCGGKAIKVAFSWGDITDECTIQCTECGARTTVLNSKEAIKRWNARKPIDAIDIVRGGRE
jgi:Lar family restriction alleviation protein